MIHRSRKRFLFGSNKPVRRRRHFVIGDKIRGDSGTSRWRGERRLPARRPLVMLLPTGVSTGRQCRDVAIFEKWCHLPLLVRLVYSDVTDVRIPVAAIQRFRWISGFILAKERRSLDVIQNLVTWRHLFGGTCITVLSGRLEVKFALYIYIYIYIH